MITEYIAEGLEHFKQLSPFSYSPAIALCLTHVLRAPKSKTIICLTCSTNRNLRPEAGFVNEY